MDGMNVDLGDAIVWLGVLFWLFGGAEWVREKTRQLKLDNDLKEAERKNGNAKSKRQ